MGISRIEEARRAYRELIVTTPGLGECISGVILYDETIRQQKKDGTPFVKSIAEAGIIPGIKVDTKRRINPGAGQPEAFELETGSKPDVDDILKRRAQTRAKSSANK